MVGCNLQRDEKCEASLRGIEGGVEQLPSGFQEIKCHMIFNVKIGETFCRKARLVVGGHTTETPATLYLFVSRFTRFHSDHTYHCGPE